MAERPLVSVIIRIYNVAAYLGRCFDSILGQTYKNLDIVAVNDGSTDSSLDIIFRYVSRDPRINVVDKPNAGPNLAFRDGMAAARGEYVVFVDGDDFVDPGYVESLMNIMQARDCTMVAPSMVRVKKGYASLMPHPGEDCLEGLEYMRLLLRHNIFAGVSGKLYRREAWSGVRFYPGIAMWEDFIINLQVSMGKGFRALCFAPAARYYYLQRPGSMQRRRQSFAYMELLDNTVAEIMSRDEALAERFRIEIIANRIGWMRIYISKKHDQWIGDSAVFRDLYNDVRSNRKALRGISRRSSVWIVSLYRHRRLILVMSLAALEKWRTSVRRRTSGRVKIE